MDWIYCEMFGRSSTLDNKNIELEREKVSEISLKEATYMDLLEMRECIEQK